MKDFAGAVHAGSRVLDVGSSDVGSGNYRQHFGHCTYHGLDIAPGNNVDIVAADPYAWDIPPEFYDFVISGQCLEHVEYPWLTIKEMARVLKPGGRLFIIVPFMWPEHKFPIDTYRYLPDGLTALGKWAGLTTEWATIKPIDGSLADCCALLQKPVINAGDALP